MSGEGRLKGTSFRGPQLGFKENTKFGYIRPPEGGCWQGRYRDHPEKEAAAFGIVLTVCTIEAIRPARMTMTSSLVASQDIFEEKYDYRGARRPPPPPRSKILGQMTLKEKMARMTQLEIGMGTDGQGQSIRINPDKLRKAALAKTEWFHLT